MVKNIALIIIALSIAALVSLAFMQSQVLRKDAAITECLQIAKIEQPKGEQTVTTPENYWYTFCMKEKGLK